MEAPWSHIVLSVGDVELSLLSIDSDAVGDLDILLRAVLDEVAVDDLLALGVDDGVADRVCPRDVAPFGAVDEEGVTGERHVGAGDVKRLGDLLGLGVEDKDLRGDLVVVPTRGYPDLPVVIQLEAVEVDGDVDLLLLGEGLQVDDGDGLVVVGDAVATRVGDIELISLDDELVGLVAYGALRYDFEGSGIDLGDVAEARIGVDLDGAGVGADIGKAILEDDVAAVGDGDLPDVLGGAYVHDLDEVGDVDDGIEAVAIDL